MDAFTVTALLEAARASGAPFTEFLRHPSLSCGIYRIPAGGTDDQVPHREDEIYLVLHGSGRLRVAGDHIDVAAGSLVYVAAHADHRFFDVTEDLEILVIFAPAYSGRHQDE